MIIENWKEIVKCDEIKIMYKKIYAKKYDQT